MNLNLIHLQNNVDLPHIYDVDLNVVEALTKYSSIECHISFLPYSRMINANHIKFYPYKEYIQDISDNESTVYSRIDLRFNRIFGILLAVIIALLFWAFKPVDLLSVQSIVSVFGAYTIGKEIWSDLEDFLVKITKNWRLSFQPQTYSYSLDRSNTLLQYLSLAEFRRYGKYSLHADKMDFIEQSNSQILKMKFNKRGIRKVADSIVHLFSFHITPDLAMELKKTGYMFGVKISFNKKFLFVTKKHEVFQSIDKKNIGCLDSKNKWVKDGVFYRQTFTLARLKLYWKSEIIRKKKIIL
jgi:hypothetical protein